MGKRSSYRKRRHDFYETPAISLLPILPHLPPKVKFVEPTAGRAHFILGMEEHGHRCVEAYDIKQRRHKWHGEIKQADVLDPKWKPRRKHDYIITNPPWSRHLLHEMIVKFSDISPTWLMFDSDWYWTVQSIPFKPRLVKIVTVGRVKWIKNSKSSGVDNVSFYLFDKPRKNRVAKIFGREEDCLSIAGKYAS